MHGLSPHFPAEGWVQALRARADALLGAEWDRLALWLPVALAGGIVVYFSLRFEPPAWLLLLAAPPAAAGFALRPERPFLAWLCGLAAAFLLGLGTPALHAALAPPMPELPRGAVELTGRVADLEALPEGVRLTLDRVRLSPEAPELGRTVRLRLQRGDPLRPEPGSVIRVRALLRAPAAPAVPGGWDFQRSAFFEGLGASGFAIGRAEILAEAGGRSLARLRAEVERRVAEAIPGPAGAVAAALLTGRQRAIAPEDIRAMRDSGLAHLLSVSGLHIGIVMGVGFAVVAGLLRLCPPLLARADIRKPAALAALLAGLCYLLLTGAAVPVQRAFAMAALVMLGLFLDRTAISLRTVAAAATLVLLLRPDVLLGPSFQMSFAAVLALVAGFEAARPRLERLRRAPAWWRVPLLWAVGLLLSSVLAAAATMPFGLHHFGRLQWYGVAANALAVPLTSLLVMPAGMLGLALMPLGLEAVALAPMGWGVEGILAVAHTVASWPGAAQAAVPLPAAGALLSGFGLCWLCLWRTAWRFAGVPILALGLSAGAWQRPPDLLVSGDSRWILVRLAEGAYAERGRGAVGFQREAMLRAWALAAAAPLPRGGEAAGGAIRCDAAACRISLPGGEVLLLRPRPGEERPMLAPERCAGAVLVVSAAPLRGRCPGVAVLDRFSTWREGAHAVRLEGGGARVLSDRSLRGERPWVPPPPRPRAPAQPGEAPPPPEEPPEEAADQ